MFTSNYNRLLALEEELLKQKKSVKHRKNNKSQKEIKTKTYLPDSNRLLQLEQGLINRRKIRNESQIKHNQEYQRMAKMLNYEKSANNKILELQQSLSQQSYHQQKRQKGKNKKSRSQKTQAMTFDYNEAIELQYQGDSFAASVQYTTTEQFDLEDNISAIEVESFEVEENDNQTLQAVIPEVLPPAEETESEQAADAEAFEADIQAILSGAKTYEPKQKTSDASSLSQTKNNPQTNNNQTQENTPTNQTPSPQPQAENPHAIFDKIAQNMAYANSFDLGTISLEQRFDEFDDLLDAQESKALTVKSSPSAEENLVELNDADFEQDLALMSEALNNQKSIIDKLENVLKENAVVLGSGEKYNFAIKKPVFNFFAEFKINGTLNKYENKEEEAIYYDFQQDGINKNFLVINSIENQTKYPTLKKIFQINFAKIGEDGEDNGIRFLPYKDDKITYCKLDENATWFFTGPLTGCHIYIGYTDNGSSMPYVFHVNDNKTKNEDININMLVKDLKVIQFIEQKLPNFTETHRLRRTDYRSKNESYVAEAFVYGKKINNEWKFYVHCFEVEFDSENKLKGYNIKLGAKEIVKSNYQNLK